jgi:hypothetical protein
MKKHYALFFLILAGCSSHQNVQNQNFPTDSELEEKVISRIDELNARPSWFKESDVFKIADGNVISLGASVIPGDHRVDAAIRIAQSNAKAGICSAIEQRLDYVFQNAQEGTAIDSNQVRFIGAEACKMTTSSIRNGKIYWEKVASRRDSGERFSQYKVFATVQMTESDLKLAILEVINKSAGKGGLSKDFAKKLEQHWDQFTKPENTLNASEEKKSPSREVSTENGIDQSPENNNSEAMAPQPVYETVTKKSSPRMRRKIK